MNKYKEIKERYQKELDNFPIFFAFNEKQFEEGMRKLGLNPNDTDKIYKLNSIGGFYKKSDAPALNEMYKRHESEMKNAIDNDDDFIYDMFYYELGNHEYVVTNNVTDTLSALGYTLDDVYNDTRLLDALQRACKDQKEWYALHG